MSSLTTDEPAARAFRQLRDHIRGISDQGKAIAIQEVARDLRREVVRMISHAGMGHVGGDLSVADILATLYTAVLKVDPAAPDDPGRDRFIMSKGHCAASLYAMLARAGFFSATQLATFMSPLSPLNGHPNARMVPGVEANTGPLGHGLPVAAGCALAARLQGSGRRAVVIVGDGELQEGSNWEAMMFAVHQRLSRLTVVVDRNQLQQGARTEETVALEPLTQKLEAFGLEVRSVDGHDVVQLLSALRPPTGDRPVTVVASTTKGHGVSFMEDRAEWHHKVPTGDQAALALEELSA